MEKPLDPKAIEAERQTSSRAERREQKRRQMQDEISYNQRGNGVIIIPPQKRRELAEEPPKLRVRVLMLPDKVQRLLEIGFDFGFFLALEEIRCCSHKCLHQPNTV